MDGIRGKVVKDFVEAGFEAYIVVVNTDNDTERICRKEIHDGTN